MELQFERKPIRCLSRCVWDWQETEQTQEVRLSDDMPDIGSVLCAWGQCVLRGKEWRTGNIGVNGGVMAWVLYQPADGSDPRMVEGWLPMQCKWSMADTPVEGNIRTRWLLKNVDGRMLSARKLMIRANAQVLAEALLPGEQEICQPVELPEDVQLLKCQKSLVLPTEAGEKAFSVDEDITVPGFEKLVSIHVEPVVNEQAVVGGKAVFRGDARVHMVYMGQDGRIHSTDGEYPFSQFADLDRDYDKEATLCVMGAVSNMETELMENGLRLKATMVMQYVVSDREDVQIVVDAYSPHRAVTCQFQPMKLAAEQGRRKEKLCYRGEFATPMGQVADVTVWPVHGYDRCMDNLCKTEVTGQAQVLYYDDSGQLSAQNTHWTAGLETPRDGQSADRILLKSISQPAVQISEVEGSIDMDIMTETDGETQMVSGLTLGEPEKRKEAAPSLILRRAGEESLWNIAKKTGSTVEAIRSANSLEDEPDPGRMLLIPVV